MTLADRLRSHDPAAVREVHDAITAARGVLVDVGARLTGGSGTPSTQARAAGRLVALAGLEEQLAAVQQEHGTGQRGRPVKRRARLTVQITGAALDVLSPATRAA